MTDYDRNLGIPQEPSPLQDVGFNGNFHVSTNPSVAYQPTTPYNSTSPLKNEVNESSDTVKGTISTPAGDFARRT